MAIIKKGVLRRTVVTLWAAISLSYVCLLQISGSQLTGLQAISVSALAIVAGAFAVHACEQLLKIEQTTSNHKEWWGLAYTMLKLPAFTTAVFLIGLMGFSVKGTIGTYTIISALVVGLFGFLYLLSKAYEKIYSFTASNAA